MTQALETSGQVVMIAYRGGQFVTAPREVPEETAIAISVNGSTHAVMMATPDHVRDLALGLALNERIIAVPDEIERLEIEASELGLDCRLWLTAERASTYVQRRRQMTGPVGCGLCGVESLELAARELPMVTAEASLSGHEIARAMDAMSTHQVLGARTRAVHAAAFHDERGHVVTREDVGRHNALDKVAGHLASEGIDSAAGFLTITSRVSVELIQKAAVMGTGLIAAVSVPTALAIRAAEGAGVTLVAIARGEEFEVFTHPWRVAGATPPARNPLPVPERPLRAAGG
ncbi:formate dehydrogenase accessory sulfurtransferase FdhD [Aureimonas mangrovi]|uniref:formate dehydrogenase accessory sulfurtransferase FdhD n=1 Tax=Aureimonas mangrovi TaxID=2758041 RepID=UPI00163D7D91|nr:formate dehydrogenase accessory sulfurtransferase FdhD [Aureimonas mangrovi]